MLLYLTTNPKKFEEAQKYLNSLDIVLEAKELEIPEIQAENSVEISKYSAEYATDLLDTPFFVMDRSLHIAGLKGFPGPYVKYMNKWFDEKNLNALFEQLTNFDAYWQTSIALSNKGGITVFEGKLMGSIVKEPKGNAGWLFDKYFVPANASLTLAEMSDDSRDSFWTSCTSWKKFSSNLISNLCTKEFY